MDKFGRNYKLFVEADARTFEEVEAGVEAGEMREITLPLSIDFDIKRNVLSSANTSSFKIYNLAEETRNELYKDNFTTNEYRALQFDAGYGDITPTIFKGNLKQGFSVREGVNYTTSLEAYDGGFAFINGQTNTSFPKGTAQNEILESILQTLPQVNVGAVGSFKKVSKRGNTFSGNTVELIQKMTEGKFFVDLEKSFVLNDDECIAGAIDVIDASTGLLGTPRREETILTFDMIFEPRLLVGQSILLQSQTEKIFNGLYKVISMHHRGTISGSVSGSAITTVGLWYGPQILKLVNR